MVDRPREAEALVAAAIRAAVSAGAPRRTVAAVAAAAVGAGAVATGAVQQSPAQAAMSPIIQQQLMPSVAAPATAEPVNFVQEIQSMLYSFGDSRRPRLETAILVDDIGKCHFHMRVFKTKD